MTAASTEAVRVEHKGDALLVTLANPPANPLSIATMQALRKAILKGATENTVRAVVIAHEGKIFSAGHDLKEMTARRRDADRGHAFFRETFDLCTSLMMTVVECPKPVIAAVDGLATAAGCQLVATCDLAVVTTNARFCTPGVNIGLFCSTPMVALSRNIGRKQAMEMLVTGHVIDAGTALQYGLVNRVVEPDALNQSVEELVQTIAAKSPLTLKIGKKAFYEQAEMPLREAYAHTARVMVENMLTRDAEEGIDAFVSKREPVWQGR